MMARFYDVCVGWSWPRIVAGVAVVLWMTVVAVGTAECQSMAAADQPSSGSTAGAIAGVALGFYSGGLAANLGSTIGCTETAWGAGCIRTMTLLGAAVGATAGAYLGGADDEAIGRAAVQASIGFGIGGAFGLLSMQAKSAVGWHDALMLGLIGGAIAAKPVGAGLGFAAGGLIGIGLEAVVPRFGIPEVVATALAGMAAGILVDWVKTGADAQSAVTETRAVRFALPLVKVSL